MEWQGNSLKSLATTKLGIIPCCLCEDCYVKADHFWCNHCCNLDGIIAPIINEEKGIIMEKVMKVFRGKVSGEQVSFVIDKIKEIEGEKKCWE